MCFQARPTQVSRLREMNRRSVMNERLRYLALVEARRSGILPETIETREVGTTRGWVKFASLYDAAAQLQINIDSALSYMLVRFGAQVVNGSSGKYEIRYMYNDLPVHVSLSAQCQSCEESNVIVTRHQSKNLGSNYKHSSFDDLDSMSMRYAMTHIQEKRRYGTKRNARTTTMELPREILRKIIMFAVSSRSVRDTSEKPLQVDMYRGISDLRGTCKAFYFTLLESWNNFQCTFFNRVWERCCKERLRMCDVLSHIDPLSHRRIEMSNKSVEAMVHLSDSYVLIAQKKVNSILRFYSTPYLMIMATNERNLRGQNNYGIPTLTGFAQFIDNKRLKSYVKQALACDPPQYAEAIQFFNTIEDWNMLSIGSCRGIDSYLAMTNGEIIDSWQRKSEEFGRTQMRCFGLHNKITALTASTPERVFLPCEFRPAYELNNELCELVPFVWDIEFSIDQDQYHVVYDFVLPMRLMRMHNDCITMNIPLNMMREIIEDDVVLNEVFEKELLPDMAGLDEENFMQAASIIISRRCAYECELLFEKEYFDGHFCVLADCSKAVPFWLYHNYKVEDTSSGKELALSSLPFGDWNATPLCHEWGTTSLVANDDLGYTLNVDHRCMTRSFCNGEFIDLRLAKTFDCSPSNICAHSREHFVNNRVQLWRNSKECIVKADDLATLVNDYIDFTWERHQFAFGTNKKTTKAKTIQSTKKIHNTRGAKTRSTKKHITRPVA